MNNHYVKAVSYVRLPSARMQEQAAFAADILGLQRIPDQFGQVSFRSDARYHTLTYVGADKEPSIGIEIDGEEALATVATALEQAGFPVTPVGEQECRERYVVRALKTQDGSGNVFDLVLRPVNHGRRFFPTRDCGVVGFHNVGLRSTNLERDVAFWSALGARASDWVGAITYLRIDSAHHRIALYPSDRAGLLYMAFEVEGLDQIMQSSNFAQKRQVPIVQGPGRQTASGQIFLHLQGPEDTVFSYVTGMETIDAEDRSPRQFENTLEALCSWGSECERLPELAPNRGA